MTETLVFFNPLDEEVEFSSPTADTRWGVSGRFMPKIDFVEEETPGRPGARIRRVKTPPREIGVPVWFHGATSADLRAQLRTIVRRLYPTLGDGRLRCTGPDGTVRELVCRYAQGLEGAETVENGGTLALGAVLVFRAAEDPFWRALTPTTIDFTTGTPPAFFPMFPMRLARSSIFGGVEVVNDGDVEAWPIWTISGPGAGLTLTNDTTGEALTLSTTIAAGESITIDTSPGVKTVLLNDGTNLYPDLDSASVLFSLAPGPNAITVDLIGSTADSEVTLSYRPRYLTP